MISSACKSLDTREFGSCSSFNALSEQLRVGKKGLPQHNRIFTDSGVAIGERSADQFPVEFVEAGQGPEGVQAGGTPDWLVSKSLTSGGTLAALRRSTSRRCAVRRHQMFGLADWPTQFLIRLPTG